jgi:hypothetical protein
MKRTIVFCLVATLNFVIGCGNSSNEKKVEQLTSTGPTRSCTATYQAGGPGTVVTKTNLAVTKQDSNSMTLNAEHEGYTFQVVWHFTLTTLYMTIKKGAEQLGFSTSRIPDKDHNDSVLDVGTSPRVWVACDFVEFRPKP